MGAGSKARRREGVTYLHMATVHHCLTSKAFKLDLLAVANSGGESL